MLLHFHTFSPFLPVFFPSHSLPISTLSSIFVCLPPLQYLYQGVCTDDLAAILCAKVHGGDINFVNVDDEGKTPMLIAVEKVQYIIMSYTLKKWVLYYLVSRDTSTSYMHYSVIYIIVREGVIIIH